ncbi:Sec-independent protein translocase subunit TatA [Corynebacterium sp. 153RC1]|uniref:Sec-independent protein translocase subunit TatA n=1 Tax=unclassified Corynebacterium TaxID=2624378 RepID=UPI00211CBA52|nr:MULTISPECIES: Sec-independent protein translocase subunit TatA [unclassified Corynebacterium]MCQ9352446.1 Sec-independent protein translocase subunit TatA [Corynebacterium sp. 209RC1]MCQ9354382.1 Sec-independent protein translocase subunit TatA [Corynebacterium sp. 1222RC1]MCQ9356729.1 Sec-independent protein translocase subunit TatA [Corynebacterium sp. 122RC1]MCQ9358777.1 Sec-independent protein translocase subunit TatA [Corynebacterium sp. 142RC1]MCQ9361175.1 Sec-independent protein tran
MSIGPLEIGIVVLLVVLLFGAKKLPDAARSLGRSMRIFKSEVKEMKNDDERFEQQRQINAANQQNPAGTAQPNVAPLQQPIQQPVEQPIQQPLQQPYNQQ